MLCSFPASSLVISRVAVSRSPLLSRTPSFPSSIVRFDDSKLENWNRLQIQWRADYDVSALAGTSPRFRVVRQSCCAYYGSRSRLDRYVGRRTPNSDSGFVSSTTATQCFSAELPARGVSCRDAGARSDDKITTDVELRRKRRRSAVSLRIIDNDDQSLLTLADNVTDSVLNDAGQEFSGCLRTPETTGRGEENSFGGGLKLRRHGMRTDSPSTSSSVNDNESDGVRQLPMKGQQTPRAGRGQRFAASRLVPPVPEGQQLLGRWQVSLNSRKDQYRVLQSSGSTARVIGAERTSGVSCSKIEPRSSVVDSTSSSITSSSGTSSSTTRTATSSSNSSSGRLFPYLPWPGGQVIIEGDAEAEAAADAAVEAEMLERRQRGREQAKKRVYGPRSDEERRRMSEGRRELERRTGHLSRIARERFADPERKERLRAAMMKGYYEKNAPSKISAKAKERCADPSFRQLIGRAMTGLPFHCTACGQVGHRRNFCPSLGYVKQDRARKGLRGPMQCSNCGKLGHNRRSCQSSLEHATEGSRLVGSAALKGVKQERARNGLKRVLRCSECGGIGHNRRTCKAVNSLQLPASQIRNAEPT